ncbi:MAG: ribose-5-phosphate isomerase RpiA [Gammaproteobacteria bacterium]|nr:ribose-5-phosphate isomerase RpiA [Gammaproteobacteria bacterium]
MTAKQDLKIKAATAALDYIEDHAIIGVGTGRTANCFIELMAKQKHRIDACVASSIETARRLRALGLVVLDLPVVDRLDVYFDGADEVDLQHRMIKGGGGALTREKIVATVAEKFVCMVEAHKWVDHLGQFPIAVEVLPMARSLVARSLVTLGGDPVYRQGFVTDNGNIILDTYHFDLEAFSDLESEINQITGVVDNGLFLRRKADVVVRAGEEGVKINHLSSLTD